MLRFALNWFHLLDLDAESCNFKTTPMKFVQVLGKLSPWLLSDGNADTLRYERAKSFFIIYFSWVFTSDRFRQGGKVLSNNFWQHASPKRCMNIFRTQLILHWVIIVTYSGISAQLKRQILSVCSRSCHILKVKMALQYQNRCNEDEQNIQPENTCMCLTNRSACPFATGVQVVLSFIAKFYKACDPNIRNLYHSESGKYEAVKTLVTGKHTL